MHTRKFNKRHVMHVWKAQDTQALHVLQVLQVLHVCLHTEKSFWNLVKSTRNQTAFTIFQLIWIETEVRLDPNQSENGKYNQISC